MAKATGGTPRWRRDPTGRRGAILNAALAEFEANGVEGAKMDSIAAAAGLSKGSVYRYFPDKMGLFEDAITTAISQSLNNYHPAPALDADTQIRRLWLLASKTRFLAAYRLSLTQPGSSIAGHKTAALIEQGVVIPFAEFLHQRERENPQSPKDLLLTAKLVVATILGASLLELSTPESIAARIAFLLGACGLDSQSPQADGF